MTHYRVVGEGSQASEPLEYIVDTAAEADLRCSTLRRLCGKFGKVEVWAKDGRRVSPEKLEKLAQIEKSEADKL